VDGEDLVSEGKEASYCGLRRWTGYPRSGDGADTGHGGRTNPSLLLVELICLLPSSVYSMSHGMACNDGRRDPTLKLTWQATT
jgi:hypothetical protein